MSKAPTAAARTEVTRLADAYPGSRKIYDRSGRVAVPMREISLSGDAAILSG